MIEHIILPEKQSTSLAGMKQYKRERMLDKMVNKINSLFYEKSQKIYLDIYNRSSFASFLNSYAITRRDEKAIDFFYNEEELKDERINSRENNFEDYLFNGIIETKPVAQEEYIGRINRFVEDVRWGFNEYLSKDFWQDFKREDK